VRWKEAIMGSKIVMISLEAAEPSLIEAWCDEGHLPALDALRKKGSWLRLHSPTEISSGATWPSMFAGVNPAKHGIAFYHRQLKSGTYQVCKKYADQVKREPFWNALSRAGIRSVIFDVPATRPMKGFNGIHIGGFGVEAPNWKRRPWPPDLVRDIKKRFGTHPLERWYQLRPETLEEWGELQEKLLSGARLKGGISKSLLDQEPWDLFFTVFSESHWSGHFFWHVMDPNHPEHRSEEGKVYGNAILDVHRELDKAIAQLLDDLEDSTVIVFSNTGMGPNYSGTHLIPEVLNRLGLGKEKRGSYPSRFLGRLLPTRRWGLGAIKQIESIIPPIIISMLKDLLPEVLWDSSTRWILGLGNDWRSSKAFMVPNDYTGAIRINLRGREPKGKVEPGQEYDTICDQLIQDFSVLMNPETGKEAVSRIYRVDREYKGENIDDLPDLIVKWAGDTPIRALTSQKIGTVSGILPDKRSGAHKTHGFLAICGMNIKKGASIEKADLMDIAPTVLHLMGQPIPRDMDGRPLVEVFDEKYRADHPVRFIQD
jgi:predicted AlkP superfamily phosphohydrolase/phosphomutase